MCTVGYARQPWKKHDRKYCSNRQVQSDISTVTACKDACAADTGCNYITWKLFNGNSVFLSVLHHTDTPELMQLLLGVLTTMASDVACAGEIRLLGGVPVLVSLLGEVLSSLRASR